jgi:hypothetical protein
MISLDLGISHIMRFFILACLGSVSPSSIELFILLSCSVGFLFAVVFNVLCLNHLASFHFGRLLSMSTILGFFLRFPVLMFSFFSHDIFICNSFDKKSAILLFMPLIKKNFIFASLFFSNNVKRGYFLSLYFSHFMIFL